jgi:hypothetical protein
MFQDTPTRIEHRKQDLNNQDLALYMQTYFKNFDLGLTLNGLILLHQIAGIQGSSFEVSLPSGATAKFRFHLKRGTVFLENPETRQVYQNPNQLLSSLHTTQAEFMNRAYAFVDGEARLLCHIKGDLEDRALRSIDKALMPIDGALSVQFAGDKIVVVRDPNKRKLYLTPLQRAMFRDGNVVFEDLVGHFKYDSLTCGDQIIPQNTNPLKPEH